MNQKFPDTLKTLTTQQMIAYLERSLSEEEEARVDRFLQENEVFLEALQKLEVLLAREKVDKEQLLAREQEWMRAIEQQRPKETVMVPLWRQKWLTYVAIAAAIGLLIWTFYPRSQPGYLQDNPALAAIVAESLEPFRDKVTTAGDPSPEVAFEQRALPLYKEKKYAEALKIMEEVITEKPENLDFNMYLGVTLLLIEKPEPQRVLDNKYFDKAMSIRKYEGPGKWYKSLALLMVERTDEAKTLLKQIQRGDYRIPAQKLLQKL